MQSSQAAFDLIVKEEDSDQNYYTKHYQHFSWPQGASGPTVGIGYDCGYVTADEIRKDWLGIIPDQMVGALLRAAGLKGEQARQFVQRHCHLPLLALSCPVRVQSRVEQARRRLAAVRRLYANASLLKLDETAFDFRGQPDL